MHLERWFEIVRLRLRSLLRRGAVERELDRELRFHLDQEIGKNVCLGLTPSEARSAALRRLGGIAQIQEECRDTRRTSYIENFIRDLVVQAVPASSSHIHYSRTPWGDSPETGLASWKGIC